MSDSRVSDVRMKAYSLLKIADKIEEASTCRTVYSKEPENDPELTKLSNFMRSLEEEQKSILGSVKSSISDLVTVASRDSSEIPFDERSQSLASLAGSRGKISPLEDADADTRDDCDDERVIQQVEEFDLRIEPAVSLELPYSNEYRAQLSRSLGPYLYSKINSSQDRPTEDSISICHSSTIFESSSMEDIDPNKSAVPGNSKPQPSLLLPIINNPPSTDSDDTIGKIRDDAESTIDSNDLSSLDSSKANDERIAASAHAQTPRAGSTESTFETPTEGSFTLRRILSAPNLDISRTMATPQKRAGLFADDGDARRGGLVSPISISSIDTKPRQRPFQPSPKPPKFPRGSKKNTKQQKNKNFQVVEQQGAHQGEQGPQGFVGNRIRQIHGFSPVDHRESSKQSSTNRQLNLGLEIQQSGTFSQQSDVAGLPIQHASTPRRGNMLRPDQNASFFDHRRQIPVGASQSGEQELDAKANAIGIPIEASEKRQKGRHVFSRVKETKSDHSSTDLKLEQQVNHIFSSPVSQAQKSNKRGPRQNETINRLSTQSQEPARREDQSFLPANKSYTTNSHEIQKEQRLVDRSEQHTGPGYSESDKKAVVQSVGSKKREDQLPSSTHVLKVTDNERMLHECYSAIVSLKETSESKYQALESKYLELKGSFSHIESQHRHPEEDESTMKADHELKNDPLQSTEREMQNKIAHLEAKNRNLVEQSKAKQSQHQALCELFSRLETQNRHQIDAAAEQDGKVLELKQRLAQLEERNKQLTLQVELSKQLETQCQIIEDRCAKLQENFLDLEAQNIKLKEENDDLRSQYQEMEAKSQKLEDSKREFESEASSKNRSLEIKLQQLEKSNAELDSKNRLLQDEQRRNQARLQALEAKCVVLEKSNDQLKSHSILHQNDKQALQSQLKVSETKCQKLEESRNALATQTDLLREKKQLLQSELQTMESKFQDLEKSNCQQKTQNGLIQNEKEQLKSRLQAIEVKCKELEESKWKLEAQNLQLDDMKEHLQSNLQTIDSKSSELERSNEKIKALQQKMVETEDDFKSKLHSLGSRCIKLEQANYHLQSHNFKLEEINESLKTMQEGLEESMLELTQPQEQTSDEKPLASEALQEIDAKTDIVSCISSESAQSSANKDDSKSRQEPQESHQNKLNKVISSQDLQSCSLDPGPSGRKMPTSTDRGHNSPDFVEMKKDANDRAFNDVLREKLNQLADSTSPDENLQCIEALDEDSALDLGYSERALQDKAINEIKGKGTVIPTANSRQNGGNHLFWGSQSPRALPPLSPRVPPSPRPPLPPAMTSSPQCNDKCNLADQPDKEGNDQLQVAFDFHTSSSHSTISVSDDLEQVSEDDGPTSESSSHEERREQSAASILEELMQDANDSGEEGFHTGLEVVVSIECETPHSSGQESRRSHKLGKQHEEIEKSLSPGQRSWRSRTSVERHNEPSLSKSSSSSRVMAALFGSKEEESPVVIPECFSTPEQSVRYDETVPHFNKDAELPVMPTFVETHALRSPNRRNSAANQETKSDTSSCEDESNSIVTQTSTRTRDLLNANTQGRKAKQTSHQLEKKIVQTPSSQRTKSPCGWFMPMDYDPPQSPPTEELPVATRTDLSAGCNTVDCGVGVLQEAILPASCTSSLARRTWNFGKKQSRATSGQHVISNSEHSSVASGTTNQATGDGTTTTAAQAGGTSSFESNSSDNGSTISTKFHTSPILAKRDKLRRKKGQTHHMPSTSSSGSFSHSEQAEKKADKKIPSRPLPFSFL